MKLVNATQMRELEKRADQSGNTYAMMMERAGKAVAEAIVARYGARAQRVLVLVGPGNNGGDGLVCARYLRDAGARVALYVWKRTERADDENLKLCRERNLPVTRAEDDANFVALRDFLADTDILVDALLGTGVTRPIEGLLKDVLTVIKSQSPNHPITQSPNHPITQLLPSPIATRPALRIVAVDLPSGLNPDDLVREHCEQERTQNFCDERAARLAEKAHLARMKIHIAPSNDLFR